MDSRYIPRTTIAAEWSHFYELVVAPEPGQPPLPEELLTEIRRTFYAGALAAIHAVTCAPPPLQPGRIKTLFAELEAFSVGVAAEET